MCMSSPWLEVLYIEAQGYGAPQGVRPKRPRGAEPRPGPSHAQPLDRFHVPLDDFERPLELERGAELDDLGPCVQIGQVPGGA